VGAVAVAISVIAVGKVASPGGAAAKVLMFELARLKRSVFWVVRGTYRVGSVDASVDHVGASTGTGAIVVGIRRGARGLGREAGQTPGGAGLRGVRVDGEDSFLLDVLDLSIGLIMTYSSG
jgi:hypothetical protein